MSSILRQVFEAMRRANLRVRQVERVVGEPVTGSLKGTLFEIFMLQELAPFWRPGNPRSEPDAVHEANPVWSFEIKTGARHWTTGAFNELRADTGTGLAKPYHMRHLLVLPNRRAFFGLVPRGLWSRSGTLSLKRLAPLNLANLWELFDGEESQRD